MTFQPGNKYGKGGSPFKKEANAFRRKFIAKMSKDNNWDKLTAQLLNLALNGDRGALVYAIDQCMGKPKDVELTDALEALQILSKPLDEILMDLMTNPETRQEIRRKLQAYEAADIPPPDQEPNDDTI